MVQTLGTDRIGLSERGDVVEGLGAAGLGSMNEDLPKVGMVDSKCGGNM